MTTQAARIADKIRRNMQYWADIDDSLRIADRYATKTARDTPLGSLWQFPEGSIMLNNDRHIAAVATGEDLRQAREILKEIPDPA